MIKSHRCPSSSGSLSKESCTEDAHLTLADYCCDACAVLQSCDFCLVLQCSPESKVGQFIEIRCLIVAEEGVLLAIANQIHKQYYKPTSLSSALLSPFSQFPLFPCLPLCIRKEQETTDFYSPTIILIYSLIDM